MKWIIAVIAEFLSIFVVNLVAQSKTEAYFLGLVIAVMASFILMCLKFNEIVILKNNLSEELTKLDFEENCIRSMQQLMGTKQKIYSLWVDNDTQQQYATVDLCVEIPVQCLELI